MVCPAQILLAGSFLVEGGTVGRGYSVCSCVNVTLCWPPRRTPWTIWYVLYRRRSPKFQRSGPADTLVINSALNVSCMHCHLILGWNVLVRHQTHCSLSLNLNIKKKTFFSTISERNVSGCKYEGEGWLSIQRRHYIVFLLYCFYGGERLPTICMNVGTIKVSWRMTSLSPLSLVISLFYPFILLHGNHACTIKERFHEIRRDHGVHVALGRTL